MYAVFSRFRPGVAPSGDARAGNGVAFTLLDPPSRYG